MNPVLSVIVPTYNEAKTIQGVIEQVEGVSLDKEIIVVDDGSTDGTEKILREIKYPNLKVIYHSSNRGKGAAVLTGLVHAAGEYVIVQDADYEYDPNDYVRLMSVAQKGEGDLILGVRFTQNHKGVLISRAGNRLLTMLLNLLFGVKLSDCFSCYKLIRREALLGFALESTGFDIEFEVLVKAIKQKMRIVEVPIAYKRRTYQEGKKIRIRDGLWAIIRILKFRFLA